MNGRSDEREAQVAWLTAWCETASVDQLEELLDIARRLRRRRDPSDAVAGTRRNIAGRAAR